MVGDTGLSRRRCKWAPARHPGGRWCSTEFGRGRREGHGWRWLEEGGRRGRREEGGHPLASVCQGLERPRWRILSFLRIHVFVTMIGSPDDKARARVLDGAVGVPRHAPVTHQVQGLGANHHDPHRAPGSFEPQKTIGAQPGPYAGSSRGRPTGSWLSLKRFQPRGGSRLRRTFFVVFTYLVKFFFLVVRFLSNRDLERRPNQAKMADRQTPLQARRRESLIRESLAGHQVTRTPWPHQSPYPA